MTERGGFVLFTLTFDSSPIKRPLQNLPSFPRRRESIAKIQLGRLRILANYRCSSEFCKGLIKGEGDSVGCFGLLLLRTSYPSGLRIKSAMTVGIFYS